MQVGDELGGYRLERLLGAGGMGAVFEARRPGQPAVALKVLLPGADPELLARFDREARVLRHLDAPGIVRLLDYGSDRGRAYLVQELCPEGDLSGLLRKRGHLAPEEARALALQLCEALAAAHSVGVVHRDLKPANVLLAGGRPKLTDFGLARAKGVDRATLTATGVILGTPAYMAPEQLLDAREVDERSDVYALGVVLYQLLSGSLPFGGTSPLVIADAVLNAQPRPLPSEVPADLQAIVFRAMAREPQERYPSALEFATALRRQPSPLSLQPQASTGLSPTAVAALVLVGLLALVAGSLYLVGGSPALPSTPAISLIPASATPQGTQGPAPPPQSPSASPTLAESPLDAALEACRDPERLSAALARIESLARADDPEACLAYGRLILGGFGVKRSRDRAGHYLSRAKQHGIWEATLLLACCHPPSEWDKRRQESLKDLTAEAQLGNRAALRFVALNRVRLPRDLYQEVVRRVDASAALRELHVFNLVQGHSLGQEEALDRLRPSSSLEARLSRCRIALLAHEPLQVEPDLVELLKQLSAEGSAMAAGLLGEALWLERLPGASEEARPWLERAALRGRGDAAFVRWRTDPSDLSWLKLAAAFGHGEALTPLGEALSQSQPREAESWLDAAFQLRGDPRAAGLLARLRRSREPTEAMRLARIAASQPDPTSLQLYGELLLDPEAAGRADPWGALEIIGAEACLGDGAAAVRAAKLSQLLKLPATVTRALLRRALYDDDQVVRAEAERQLRGLTAGISATAPVRSQSQLVLLRRSKDKDRAAIIEVGRRASLEAPRGRYLSAVRAAAETGDLESRLRWVRLRAADAGGYTKEQLQELQEIGEQGLPEAWLFAAQREPDRIRLEPRLRHLAEAGAPEALYAYGVYLCRREETRASGLELLARAEAAGLTKAAEYTFSLQVKTLSREELQSQLREARGRFRTLIACALLGRRERGSRKLGRRALLTEVLSGAPPQDSYTLGKHLIRAGERTQSRPLRTPEWSAGTLWVRVAANQKLANAQILVGQLYLGISDPTYQSRGFRLVEELSRRTGLRQATLATARARLRGHGTPVDFARAEQGLTSLAADSPHARALLGQLYAARGEAPRALSYLSQELADGNPYARVPLAQLHLAQRAPGTTVPRGLNILKQGAKLGEAPSCQLLADLYQHGRVVERNLELAERYRRLTSKALGQTR